MSLATRKKVTRKIFLSYALLGLLGVSASFFIYNEIEKYTSTEILEENDEKLLMTSSLLTKIYEAENLSKLMLQQNSAKNIKQYSTKVDSIMLKIDSIKSITNAEEQLQLLDSVGLLLQQKVANSNQLRKLLNRKSSENTLDSILKGFSKMEQDLGRITPESLVPNFENLSPGRKETFRGLAAFLNDNVPKDSTSANYGKKMDSVLSVSKAVLSKAIKESQLMERGLALRETALFRTDLELSQKLQRMVSEIDREIAHSITTNDALKQKVLTRSIRLAGIAAIIGLLVVGIFTFIISRDFFRVQLLKNQLEDEKKFSDSLLKSREQLIATVSHDLRTPLNTISGYTDLLKDSLNDKTHREYATKVGSASEYVENLVNDLLDFSKIEAGKIELQPKTFDLGELIQETARESQRHYAKAGVKLNLVISKDFDKPIISDPVRIRQILGNLIGNAFKFTKIGTVTIDASKQKNRLAIAVIDTGVGIKKELQDEIFKEFSQGNQNTEEKFSGYGLGLTISKKLAHLLDGDITLFSKENEGSTFTFSMPLIFSNDDTDKIKKTSHLSRPQTVLVIDDDSALLGLISELLLKNGHHALIYNDFENVPKTERLTYDLVLTDIQMPNIDGFSVLKLLKSGNYIHYKNQPIVAMTGDRSRSLDDYIEAGFTEIIQKPFSKTVLLQKLGLAIVENSQHHKNSFSTEESAQSNEKATFNLTSLYAFLGDDTAAVADVVKTFLKELKINMDVLKRAIKNEDSTTLKKTVHRMLPMLRQLEAEKIVSHLEILEHLEVDLKEIPLLEIYEVLKTNVSRLISDLQEWLYQTSRP